MITYIVTLPCYKLDHKRGGHVEIESRWQVRAENASDAYKRACFMAEKRGYFWLAPPDQCQILLQSESIINI